MVSIRERMTRQSLGYDPNSPNNNAPEIHARISPQPRARHRRWANLASDMTGQRTYVEQPTERSPRIVLPSTPPPEWIDND